MTPSLCSPLCTITWEASPPTTVDRWEGGGGRGWRGWGVGERVERMGDREVGDGGREGGG